MSYANKILGTMVLAAAMAMAGAGVVRAEETPADLARFVFPANSPASVSAPHWLADESGYAELSDDGRRIVVYDTKSGKELSTLLDLSTTRENTLESIDGFEVSADGKKVMVYTDKEMIYRRSFTASYWVYDTHSRILTPLSESVKRQRAPLFSPDGRMVAFVDPDNNIRIKKLDYGTEVMVTTDGGVNKVLNGVPDWTYEEEFYVVRSMVWSPDNLTLCYLRYDESATPLYRLAVYEGACDPKPEYALYPGVFEYKYPVAGERNSVVTLHSYDVETRKVKDIALGEYEYIPRLDYTPQSDCLMVATLNRDQNALTLHRVNPRAATERTVLTETTPNGWVEPLVYESLSYYDDFFVMASSRSGWARFYRFGYSGALESALTPDGEDATAYYGYDAAGRRHYWQTTGGNPLNRVVGFTDERGRTTVLSNREGTSVAVFSPSHTTAMLTYSNTTTPPVYTMVNAKDFKTLRVMEDNADYAADYASIPRKEFFTIAADSEGPSLNGYIVRSTKGGKSPVIMYQYSGPGSQTVLNKWNVDWMQYYATQGYTVVCVDGRGTGGRGSAFREAVYKNLGYYETIDQLRAARYVKGLGGIDPERLGMFGWSFGGYETLMCVTDPANPFKAACAVAPVTSWRLYDTVYTERYMLPPKQNEDGYNRSAPLERIENFGDCRVLLMTGTADDNVHPANSIDFIGRLISAGKICDYWVFPNMNHSINYCNGRVMVYWRMLDHFNRNL